MAFFGFKQSNTAMSSMIRKLKAAGDVEPSDAEAPAQTTAAATATAAAAAAAAAAEDLGQVSEASAVQSNVTTLPK